MQTDTQGSNYPISADGFFRIAFTMKLFKGFEKEYHLRHQALWPELTALLKQAGIVDYSIFLDEASLTLFGCFKTSHPEALAHLPDSPVMQRWWAYMGDIMETNPDHSPVSVPLKEVFYLP